MGSTSSKPSTAIPVGSASSYEKQSYSHSYSTSTSSHHASDRLARIQAEQSHRQSTPRKLSQNKDASATVSLDAIDRWDDKALSVSATFYLQEGTIMVPARCEVVDKPSELYLTRLPE